jgi:hypothetical protein
MNLQETVELEELCDFAARPVGEEPKACLGLDPKGFFIRHPPTPHHLISFITPEEQLFQTIHMGGAVIDTDRYSIIVDGLVRRPFRLPLAQLKKFPSTTLTAFHECYGSPLKPPTENLYNGVLGTSNGLECVYKRCWILLSHIQMLDMSGPRV